MEKGDGTPYQCSAWHAGLLAAQTLDSGLSKLAGTGLHKCAYICITPEELVLTSMQGYCLDQMQSSVERDGRKLISVTKRQAQETRIFIFFPKDKEGLHLASLCVCHQLFLVLFCLP